jgi:hypothetical protein
MRAGLSQNDEHREGVPPGVRSDFAAALLRRNICE